MENSASAGWLMSSTDDADFESFLRAHEAAAFRVCLSITGDRERAGDARQEAFLRLWRNWRRVQCMESAVGFLLATAARCAMNELKRKPALPVREGGFSHDLVGDIAVAETLGRISPEHRTVLALSVAEGWSYDEISKVLDIPPGTVASRIHAAKEQFRKLWEESE